MTNARGIARDERLETPHGIEVEMVRRLVEHEPVRLLEQGAREQRARALAAGELAERSVEIDFRELEAVQRRPHLPLGGVAARHCFIERGAQRRGAAFRCVLREITEPALAGTHDRAAVGLVDAGQDAHQRRLPGPVRPDEPDAVALAHDA